MPQELSVCQAEHSFSISPARSVSDQSFEPSEESYSKNIHQIVGTLVEYPEVDSECSSQMSRTLSNYDKSFSNMTIRFNTTERLKEDERAAFA